MFACYHTKTVSDCETVFIMESDMDDLKKILEQSAARHSHLCPRQVLGVRMGLAGAEVLGITVPQKKKEMVIIVETDGCFADGIEVATGCTMGHRTLRMEDYGKIAATFVESKSGRAVRMAPRPDVRSQAYRYAPDQTRKYFAQLEGYRRMPVELLFNSEEVILMPPIKQIVSRPGVRVNCQRCGEEIINQRELYQGEAILCKACAGSCYYQPLAMETTGKLWSIRALEKFGN